MAPDGSRWLLMHLVGCRGLQIAPDGSRWPHTAPDVSRLLQLYHQVHIESVSTIHTIKKIDFMKHTDMIVVSMWKSLVHDSHGMITRSLHSFCSTLSQASKQVKRLEHTYSHVELMSWWGKGRVFLSGKLYFQT